MSEYITNRESLKRHCEAMCKKFKDVPTSGTYGEHRLVLELLEQTEWIPVSERLPEFTINNTVSEDVLVFDGVNIRVGEYRKGKYLNGAGYWCIYGLEEYVDVIAWMPLPKPYEQQESEVSE